MGSKGQSTSSTNQSQTYNPAGSGYITNALNQAQSAAQQPFNIPQAPVAGFSQDQLSAFNTVNNAQGMAQPYINQASQYFTPQGAQQFLNPYASNVMAGLQDVFGQQNSQNTGQLTQAAGGVGADRIGVGQANLAKEQGLAAGQTLSGLYSNAVQQAQSAGYGQAALGSQAQNAALSGAQAQLATGGLQQQLQQAQLNAPYQQQLAQSAFPYQQAQFLAGITGSLAPGLGGTTSGYGQTTSQAAPPSIWSQILGAGTAAAGVYGQTGGFGKGSSPSYGNGNGVYGGSSQNPLPGLSPSDYGEGYDIGGSVSDDPIDVSHQSIIPDVKMQPMQTHQPTLNLSPPAPAANSGGGAGDAVKDIAKIAMMFANRGGRTPYDVGGVVDVDNQIAPDMGFADGGDTGGMSDVQPLQITPQIRQRMERRMQNAADDEATQRVIRDAARYGVDWSHYGRKDGGRAYAEGGDVSPYSIAPMLDTEKGVIPIGGAPAPAAKPGPMSVFPAGYYDKVPQDMRLSRTGVSHPGFRWEVYDPKSGAVMRKDMQTASGARLARDRLDNKYGGYRYQTRPVQAKEMQDHEAQWLQDNGITLGGGEGMATGGRAYADGGTPEPVWNPDEPFRMPAKEDVDDWRSGVDAFAGPDIPPAIATSTSARRASAAPSASPAGGPPPERSPYVAPAAEREADPEDPADSFAKSPWAALTAAGLGMMAGTSPYAGVNIGQGGMQGVKTLASLREAAQKDTTIAQSAKRLAQEAQFHEDQFTRESVGQKLQREISDRPYSQLTAAQKDAGDLAKRKQELEEMKPVQVGQDDWGRPIMARRNPKSGEYEIIETPSNRTTVPPAAGAGFVLPDGTPAPAKADDAAIPPGATPTQGLLPSGTFAKEPPPDTVNPAALEGLSTADANKVKAIAEGRARYLPLTRNNAYNRKIMDKVMEYDPGSDELAYSRRSRTANFFAVGTQGGGGQNIASMNTFGQHADELMRLAKELDAGQYKDWNEFKNAMARKGYTDKEVQDKLGAWEVAQKAVGDEGAKVFAGSQSALADREAWSHMFDASNPRSVTETKLKEVVKLITGRLNSLTHQYNDGMRTNHAPVDFIAPRTQEIFDNIVKGNATGEPPKGPPAARAAAAPAAVPAAAAAPAAAPAADKPKTITQGGFTYTLQPDGTYK